MPRLYRMLKRTSPKFSMKSKMDVNSGSGAFYWHFFLFWLKWLLFVCGNRSKLPCPSSQAGTTLSLAVTLSEVEGCSVLRFLTLSNKIEINRQKHDVSHCFLTARFILPFVVKIVILYKLKKRKNGNTFITRLHGQRR